MNRIMFLFVKLIGFKVFEKEIRRKSTLAFLKALQVVRKSFLGIFFMITLFQLMVIGFVGSVYGLIFIWPELEPSTRLYILFGTSLMFFLVPFSIFMLLLSDKIWFRASGAEKMLKGISDSGAN